MILPDAADQPVVQADADAHGKHEQIQDQILMGGQAEKKKAGRPGRAADDAEGKGEERDQDRKIAPFFSGGFLLAHSPAKGLLRPSFPARKAPGEKDDEKNGGGGGKGEEQKALQSQRQKIVEQILFSSKGHSHGEDQKRRAENLKKLICLSESFRKEKFSCGNSRAHHTYGYHPLPSCG